MRRRVIAGHRRGRLPGLAGVVAVLMLASAAGAAEGPLDVAIAQAQRLVVPADTTVLAASASSEGHWTFVNAKGERFTAATPDEMARMTGVLAAGTKEAGGKLVVVVTEASVFGQAEAMAKLPREASLRLSTATGLYALTGSSPRYIQISPRLRVEVGERAAFDEILLQLDKSLARGGIRVIALVPGGPETLVRRVGIDGKAPADLIERIEPVRLKNAIAGLRGQTIVVTGRLDGRLLHFQVSGGPDRSVIADDLIAAATTADANLIILDAAAGRQPGARNWLWLRAEVKGIDTLTPDSGLDALLDKLATDARPLNIKMQRLDADSAVMIAVPGPSATGAIGDALGRVTADWSGQVTGRIEPTAIHMYMVSAARQRELDRRLVRWLPAAATWGYLGLLLLGATGARVSRRWWAKVWPQETATDYSSAIGLQAARAVRGVAYVLVFVPATAIAAAPMSLAGAALRRPT